MYSHDKQRKLNRNFKFIGHIVRTLSLKKICAAKSRQTVYVIIRCTNIPRSRLGQLFLFWAWTRRIMEFFFLLCDKGQRKWIANWLVDWLIDWLIDWIEFYAVSAIFQPCDGEEKRRETVTSLNSCWMFDVYVYTHI